MTMYLVLRLLIFICTSVVFALSMAILKNESQMLYDDINELIERYLRNTKPHLQINLILDQQVITAVPMHIFNNYRTSHPVIVSDTSDKLMQYNAPWCYKMHFIIGVFKTSKNVRANEWKKFYNQMWNPAASIAIWIIDPTNLDDIKEVLETFWQDNSLDVIVITFDILKNTTNIYSYDPFVIKSDNTRGEILQIAPDDTLYPDKLKNLHGHSIPISIYEHQPHASLNNFTELADGVDVNYCKTLAQWMNFTINLKTAPVDFLSYGVYLPNGTKYGVVGDIVTDRSNMLGNSMHWELTNDYKVENAYPRWRSKIVILVPRAKPLPGIFRLFKSGSGITMALICSALCLLFIILTIKGDNNALLKTFSLMLNQTFGKIGSKSSERIFCIAWIFWSLVLISSFQGKLLHDISAPPYHNDMNSLQALYKSNLTLMTKIWEYKMINNSYVDILKQLAKISIVDINSTECVIKLMTLKNVACTVDGSYADYIIGQVKKAIFEKRQLYKNIDDSWNIHIMKKPLFYYWRTYIVRNNFVYLKKVDKLAVRLVEFGIMKKWVRQDLAKNVQVSFTNNNAKPLDLVKVHNVFIILIYGHIIATIVLVIEIIYYKLKHRYDGKVKIKISKR